MTPTTESPLIVKAREFARKHHYGQFRRNGEHYFDGHVEPVAKITQKLIDETFLSQNKQCIKDEIIAVAYLHDTIEDCEGVTAETLLNEGFSESIVESVAVLSKKSGESYFDFIMRIVYSVDAWAITVKIADLTHNLQNNDNKKQVEKYSFARYILEKEIFRKFSLSL